MPSFLDNLIAGVQRVGRTLADTGYVHSVDGQIPVEYRATNIPGIYYGLDEDGKALQDKEGLIHYNIGSGGITQPRYRGSEVDAGLEQTRGDEEDRANRAAEVDAGLGGTVSGPTRYRGAEIDAGLEGTQPGPLRYRGDEIDAGLEATRQAELDRQATLERAVPLREFGGSSAERGDTYAARNYRGPSVEDLIQEAENRQAEAEARVPLSEFGGSVPRDNPDFAGPSVEEQIRDRQLANQGNIERAVPLREFGGTGVGRGTDTYAARNYRGPSVEQQTPPPPVLQLRTAGDAPPLEPFGGDTGFTTTLPDSAPSNRLQSEINALNLPADARYSDNRLDYLDTGSLIEEVRNTQPGPARDAAIERLRSIIGDTTPSVNEQIPLEPFGGVEQSVDAQRVTPGTPYYVPDTVPPITSDTTGAQAGDFVDGRLVEGQEIESQNNIRSLRDAIRNRRRGITGGSGDDRLPGGEGTDRITPTSFFENGAPTLSLLSDTGAPPAPAPTVARPQTPPPTTPIVTDTPAVTTEAPPAPETPTSTPPTVEREAQVIGNRVQQAVRAEIAKTPNASPAQQRSIAGDFLNKLSGVTDTPSGKAALLAAANALFQGKPTNEVMAAFTATYANEKIKDAEAIRKAAGTGGAQSDLGKKLGDLERARPNLTDREYADARRRILSGGDRALSEKEKAEEAIRGRLEKGEITQIQANRQIAALYDPRSSAFQTAAGKDDAKELAAAEKAHTTSLATIENMNQLTELLDGLETGVITDNAIANSVIGAAHQLGFELPDNLDHNNRDAVTAILRNQLVTERRKLQGQGPITDAENEVLLSAQASLGKTPAANKFTIDMIKMRSLREQKLYRDWVAATPAERSRGFRAWRSTYIADHQDEWNTQTKDIINEFNANKEGSSSNTESSTLDEARRIIGG